MTITKEASMFYDSILKESVSVRKKDEPSNSNASETAVVPGIWCYQWKGDNFKEIQETLSKCLSGYVYRKDDDLIVDYNDGNSIKRMSPLDWLLVDNDASDVTILTDKMFNLLMSSRSGNILSSSDAEEKSSVREDDSSSGKKVDLEINTTYGDHLKLFSDEENLKMEYKSYAGDDVRIENSPSASIIYLFDRYGNKMKVSGENLSASTQTVKSSSELFAEVNKLISQAHKKTEDIFVNLSKYTSKAKNLSA